MPNKRSAILALPVVREVTDDELVAIVDAAQRRAALVAEMREALMAGDRELALSLARRVAGLEREIPNQ